MRTVDSEAITTVAERNKVRNRGVDVGLNAGEQALRSEWIGVSVIDQPAVDRPCFVSAVPQVGVRNAVGPETRFTQVGAAVGQCLSGGVVAERVVGQANRVYAIQREVLVVGLVGVGRSDQRSCVGEAEEHIAHAIRSAVDGADHLAVADAALARTISGAGQVERIIGRRASG